MRKCKTCDDELIVGENITEAVWKMNSYRCKSCQREYDKVYYQKNKVRIKEYKKENEEIRKEYGKLWREENPEYSNEYVRNRYKNDVDYKLIHTIRSRISTALKSNKTQRTIEYLGCSIPEYKLYLESKFDDNMTWDNHGSYWEIDHIHPLSKGGSFHYTNTQPLTWGENRRKGSKWDPQ